MNIHYSITQRADDQQLVFSKIQHYVNDKTWKDL
jgi:hypothetical protein